MSLYKLLEKLSSSVDEVLDEVILTKIQKHLDKSLLEMNLDKSLLEMNLDKSLLEMNLEKAPASVTKFAPLIDNISTIINTVGSTANEIAYGGSVADASRSATIASSPPEIATAATASVISSKTFVTQTAAIVAIINACAALNTSLMTVTSTKPSQTVISNAVKDIINAIRDSTKKIASSSTTKVIITAFASAAKSAVTTSLTAAKPKPNSITINNAAGTTYDAVTASLNNTGKFDIHASVSNVVTNLLKVASQTASISKPVSSSTISNAFSKIKPSVADVAFIEFASSYATAAYNAVSAAAASDDAYQKAVNAETAAKKSVTSYNTAKNAVGTASASTTNDAYEVDVNTVKTTTAASYIATTNTAIAIAAAAAAAVNAGYVGGASTKTDKDNANITSARAAASAADASAAAASAAFSVAYYDVVRSSDKIAAKAAETAAATTYSNARNLATAANNALYKAIGIADAHINNVKDEDITTVVTNSTNQYKTDAKLYADNIYFFFDNIFNIINDAKYMVDKKEYNGGAYNKNTPVSSYLNTLNILLAEGNDGLTNIINVSNYWNTIANNAYISYLNSKIQQVINRKNVSTNSIASVARDATSNIYDNTKYATAKTDADAVKYAATNLRNAIYLIVIG